MYIPFFIVFLTVLICTTKDIENHVFGRKEKSVLQSKLTKLAIQIGYAGTSAVFRLYRIFVVVFAIFAVFSIRVCSLH